MNLDSTIYEWDCFCNRVNDENYCEDTKAINNMKESNNKLLEIKIVGSYEKI